MPELPDHIKAFVEATKAYARGEDIQYRTDRHSPWASSQGRTLSFECGIHNYRVAVPTKDLACGMVFIDVSGNEFIVVGTQTDKWALYHTKNHYVFRSDYGWKTVECVTRTHPHLYLVDSVQTDPAV